MTIHVINCGWMRPLGGRLWDRESSGIGPAHLALRCLLIETPDGLALVDTGLGTADPARLPTALRLMDRPEVAPRQTALSRLRQLGHDPRDVRHIVMTHLDFDHAGGLTDFPWAEVHASAAEVLAARTRDGWKARLRWRPDQLPAVLNGLAAPGPDWFGLPTLAGAPGGLLLVPLPGHSPGHCGVAVPDGDGGWVLHAGDAIFMCSELEEPDSAPPLSRAYAAFMQTDAAQRHASADALRALRSRSGASLTILCTHDPRSPADGRLRAEAALND